MSDFGNSWKILFLKNLLKNCFVWFSSEKFSGLANFEDFLYFSTSTVDEKCLKLNPTIACVPIQKLIKNLVGRFHFLIEELVDLGQFEEAKLKQKGLKLGACQTTAC